MVVSPVRVRVRLWCSFVGTGSVASACWAASPFRYPIKSSWRGLAARGRCSHGGPGGWQGATRLVRARRPGQWVSPAGSRRFASYGPCGARGGCGRSAAHGESWLSGPRPGPLCQGEPRSWPFPRTGAMVMTSRPLVVRRRLGQARFALKAVGELFRLDVSSRGPGHGERSNPSCSQRPTMSSRKFQSHPALRPGRLIG